MINSLIDRFCESKRSRLIVTGVTFVAGLLTVLPQVDYCFTQRNRQQDIEEDLVHANLAAEQLPMLAKRTAEESTILAELEQRTVNEARLPDFRNSLVELVRESGCQMRRINVGQARSRPWLKGDNPIRELDESGKPTPFVLEIRPVSLSVSGANSSIRDLLARVQNEQMIYHAETMELRPIGRNRRGMQMDLELWYFALTREPKA